MSQPTTLYPAVFYELERGDPGFARPHHFRFRLDMLDGDAFYFINRQRAEHFIRLHAIKPISEAQMDEARRLAFSDRGNGEEPEEPA